MFGPHCFDKSHESQHLQQGILKTIGIISAVSAVISLIAGISFYVRTVKNMDEIDVALPLLGNAAEKYLIDQQNNPQDER